MFLCALSPNARSKICSAVIDLILISIIICLSTIRRNRPDLLSASLYDFLSISLEIGVKGIALMILLRSEHALTHKKSISLPVKISVGASLGSLINRSLLLISLLSRPFSLSKANDVTIYSLIELCILSLKCVVDTFSLCYNKLYKRIEDPPQTKGACIFLATILITSCSILNELEKNHLFEVFNEVSFFKIISVPLTLCLIGLFFNIESSSVMPTSQNPSNILYSIDIETKARETHDHIR